jgi:hypothetical protein
MFLKSFFVVLLLICSLVKTQSPDDDMFLIHLKVIIFENLHLLIRLSTHKRDCSFLRSTIFL